MRILLVLLFLISGCAAANYGLDTALEAVDLYCGQADLQARTELRRRANEKLSAKDEFIFIKCAGDPMPCPELMESK